MASKIDISKLDRRWLYLVMAASITIPFLFEYTPPVTPTKAATDMYEHIDRMPPGSKILVSCDYDPGSEAEIYPMNLAIFHHLAQKDVTVIITQLWPQAGPLVEKALLEAYFPYGKEYGTDVVNLGYLSGAQILLNKLNDSIPATFPQDVNGTPVSEIPAMEGVGNSRDIDLYVILSAGTPGTKEWVQQVQAECGKPMVSGVTAVSAPDFFAYLNSRQLRGMLGGLRGAADYEELVGYTELTGKEKRAGEPGRGTTGMGPQTFGHMLIVVFIVLGNIGFYLTRRRERSA